MHATLLACFREVRGFYVLRSRTTCSMPATAERAVARSHFSPRRWATPGWMKFRKSFASLDCFAVFGLMISSFSATWMYSYKFHRSRSFGSGLVVRSPLALRAAMALAICAAGRVLRTQRSRASAAEPAGTIAALYSPFDKALVTA